MFIDFFYFLRASGFKVTMDEWMDLLRALDGGLCEYSLTGFYRLCQTVLVKKESEYDRFDLAFAQFFKDFDELPELSEELLEWLHKEAWKRDMSDKTMPDDQLLELDALMQRLRERMEEQHERHDGGNYWIGTGGTSTMGNGGFHERGIRIGGESRHNRAVKVAEERRFKDFRQDTVLQSRQFQVALRRLRQFSTLENAEKTELDVDGTIDATCKNAGYLKIVRQRPRKNTVKLLLLFDSGGSMYPYSTLCSRLFQAVEKSNHFKEVRVFYFHNCVYDKLYMTPQCEYGEWMNTSEVLANFNNTYKVIFVGDGEMASSELFHPHGARKLYSVQTASGIDWLQRFRNRYEHQIWLNPTPKARWQGESYYYRTVSAIREMFPMFELSVQGLEEGVKRLLSN